MKIFFFYFVFLLILWKNPYLYSSTSSNIENAEKQFFLKNFTLAKQNLLEIIGNNENNQKALSLLADIYFKEKDYILALEYYNKAIALGKNNSYEKYRIGQIYLELKKNNLALGSFREAYQESSQIKESLFQIGYIYLYEYRNKNKTIEFWRKFIQESPEDPQRKKIEKIILLLEDKNFVIDPSKNPLPIEEILLFGNQTINSKYLKPKDTIGGNEKMKTQNKIKELIEDEDGL